MTTAARVIRAALDITQFSIDKYLNDMTDADLMIRPVPNANHIKWQLGHLISSEHQLINMVRPNSMPALPEGFAERYTPETSKSDDPAAFDTKDELLRLMKQQRDATLAELDRLTDEDIDTPSPERMRPYAPTVGSAFNMQSFHWLMHSGQWVIVRRMLGRGPEF